MKHLIAILFLLAGSSAYSASDLTARSLETYNPLMCHLHEDAAEKQNCLRAHKEDYCEFDRKFCGKLTGRRAENKDEWTESYDEVRNFLLKNALLMDRTAKQFSIPTEALMGVFYAEHSLNYTAGEKTFDGLSEVNCVTKYIASAFSMGPGQIRLGRARGVQERIEEIAGQHPMDYCDYYSWLMTVSGSITVAAGILNESMTVYADHGIDISKRPDILASLYNLSDVKDRAKETRDENRHPRPNFFGLYIAIHLDEIQTLLAEAKVIDQVARDANPLQIVSRDEWGAQPVGPDISKYEKYGISNPKYDRVVLHITSTKPKCGIEAIKDVEKMHRIRNGWDDVGYNFVIDRCGTVYEGRSLEYVPSHAGQTNWANSREDITLDPDLGSIGINFSARGGSELSDAQIHAAKLLIEKLDSHDNVNLESITTHHEVKKGIELLARKRRDKFRGFKYLGKHTKELCPGMGTVKSISDIRLYFSPQIPFNALNYARIIKGADHKGFGL